MLVDVPEIEVTDVETGDKQTYRLSKDNWRKAWACMRGDLVIMWVPSALPINKGSAVRTSGRIWRVV